MSASDPTFSGPVVPAGAAKRPERSRLEGTTVAIEPLNAAEHGDSFWRLAGGEPNEELWRFMNNGPFPDRASFDLYLRDKAASEDPLYSAIVNRATGEATGHAAYLRIEPAQRVIEIGAIVYTAELRKTRGATEAMYLMARHAFEELGYRRYEWKCNVLNEASERAAKRLGFTFEGIFRQHMIVKGRSRDTAWFAMLDSEWPLRKKEFERWLAEDNFDGTGRQKTRLSHI